MTVSTDTPATQKHPLRERPTNRPFGAAIALSLNPWPTALAYLALLTLAELVLVFVSVLVGIGLHMGLLLLLLLHTSRVWQHLDHRFLLGLIFVPLIRIVSVTLPLIGFPLVYWFLITSLPLFAAAIVIMRLLDFSWADAGLVWRGLPLQLLVGLSGIGLGTVEYLILRPDPLVDSFRLEQLVIPALILLFSTGYLEELIFRRIMQRTAIERLGRWQGLIYVALLFAILHIGYRSLVDFVFVLGVGIFFGWFVNKTGSLVGVTMAHGLTNVWLFLVMPFVIITPLLTDSGNSSLSSTLATSALEAPTLSSAEVNAAQPAPTLSASTPSSSFSSTATLAEGPAAAAGPSMEPTQTGTLSTAATAPTDQTAREVSSATAGFWETYGLFVLLLVFSFLMTGLLIWKPSSY